MLPDPVLDARFEEVARFHPVEVVSSGFVLATAAAIGEATTIVRYPVDLVAPFVGVEVEVTDAGSGSVVAGLAGTEEPWLRAEVEPASGAVALRLLVGGVDRTLASTTAGLPAAPWTLGLAVCENSATVLVRAADGQWEALLTGSVGPDAGLDLRDPAVLAALGVAWGVRDGAVGLGDARTGVFGMAGLRDPHLVQRPDGSPWTEDGDVFLTWTCAGFGFFPQAHWGVFRLPLDEPAGMEQVAHLFTDRDGLILGDHAGHLVRDGDAWVAANSTWGDFDGAGVGVRSVRTTEDLLRGVHLLRTEPVALPTTVSAWDPAVARVDGRWHVAFVESPAQDPFVFHPALAATDAPDPFTDLAPVGAVTSLTQTEGTLLTRDADGWRLLASDGAARRYPVYDLALTELGELDAPYGTNIPHAQVVPRPDGGWLMVTFDGTTFFEDVVGYGAHGSVVVMSSVDS